jgi:hypothetical protein
MPHTVREPVRIGELELNFLADEAHGVDSVVMFQFTVPPHARVPAPHDRIMRRYGLIPA